MSAKSRADLHTEATVFVSFGSTDAGAVKVADAVQLAEPISIQRRQLGGKDPSNISSHRRRSDHTDILKHLFLKAHLFRPYHRALFNPSHFRVCDGRSVADVWSTWGGQQINDVLAAFVPYPFADLMVQRQWWTLLVLGRYFEIKNIFPSQGNWPPAAWMERARPIHRAADNDISRTNH